MARAELRDTKADAFAYTELHQNSAECADVLSFASEMGWRATVAPARPYRTRERAGGAMVGEKKRHSSASYSHLARAPVGIAGKAPECALPASPIDFYDFTAAQLKHWGAKHHQLFLGKPSGDYYIDDKGVNDEDFFNTGN